MDLIPKMNFPPDYQIPQKEFAKIVANNQSTLVKMLSTSKVKNLIATVEKQYEIKL